jgi:hypothetical protein
MLKGFLENYAEGQKVNPKKIILLDSIYLTSEMSKLRNGR